MKKIDSRDLNVRTNDNVERDTIMIWKRKKLTKKKTFLRTVVSIL